MARPASAQTAPLAYGPFRRQTEFGKATVTLRARFAARAVAAALLVLACAPVARAQTAPSTTQSAPASQPLTVTITGVEGMVQVRESSDKPWQKAAVGMVVGEGAEF